MTCGVKHTLTHGSSVTRMRRELPAATAAELAAVALLAQIRRLLSISSRPSAPRT